MAKPKLVKLTWVQNRKKEGENWILQDGGRWKRVYKGHQLMLCEGESETDFDSKKRALEILEQKKKEIDAKGNAHKPNFEQYQSAIRYRDEIIRYILKGGPARLLEHQSMHDRMKAELDWLYTELSKIKPIPLDDGLSPVSLHPLNAKRNCKFCKGSGKIKLNQCPLCDGTKKTGFLDGVLADWYERVEILKEVELGTPTPERVAKTIGFYIDEFLAKQLKKAQASEATGGGKYSIGAYRSDVSRLQRFKKYAQNLPVGSLMLRETIENFKNQILDDLIAGDIGSYRASDILICTKQFIMEYLWKEEILENLPRKIADLSYSRQELEPNPLSLDEVKQVLAVSPKGSIERCFVLLALNCGFYQSDINWLKPSDVDFDLGRINTKRHKRKEKNGIKINWLLWGETLELIRTYGKQNGNNVFLQPDGTLMQFQNEKYARCKITEILEKLHVPFPKWFMRLRKASPQLLQAQYGDSIADLWLAHKSTSMGRKHYYKTDDWKPLDNAIAWLGEQYGIK